MPVTATTPTTEAGENGETIVRFQVLAEDGSVLQDYASHMGPHADMAAAIAAHVEGERAKWAGA